MSLAFKLETEVYVFDDGINYGSIKGLGDGAIEA